MAKKPTSTSSTTPKPRCVHEEKRDFVIMVALRTHQGGVPSRAEDAGWDTLLAAEWYLQQKGFFAPVISVQGFSPEEFEPVRVMAENARAVRNARLAAQDAKDAKVAK